MTSSEAQDRGTPQEDEQRGQGSPGSRARRTPTQGGGSRPASRARTINFATRVVSCRAAELRPPGGGEPVRGFQVVLEDTILFPEGGGQPDDRGLIGDVPVLRVTRRGAEAVHFVQAALEPGAEVLLSLDWERRFDHMQQHSGQHLVTAIAEQMFGFKTTSW